MSSISQPLSKSECEYVPCNYHDHSQDASLSKEEFDNLQSPSRTGYYDYETFCGTNTNTRSECVEYGPKMKFPLKLHWLLLKAEMEKLSDIISWRIHGRAFLINDSEKFSETFLPVYFHHTKMNSFIRQLNLYGFRKISKGPDKGAYYQELFLRGKPFLANRMLRRRGKGTKGDVLPSTSTTEPDLYAMPFVEEAPASINVSTLPSLFPNILALPKHSAPLSCFSSFGSGAVTAVTAEGIDLLARQIQYKNFLHDEGDIYTIFSGDSEKSSSDLSSFCCDNLYTLQELESNCFDL
jgi:hypothetical protein